jgi:nucleoid-associated protein EbfC
LSEDLNPNRLMQMQKRLLEIRAELGTMKFEGTAGDGSVRIVYRVNTLFETVKIDPGLLRMEQREELEQLLFAAAQDAVTQALQQVKEKTDALRSEFGLSPSPPPMP